MPTGDIQCRTFAAPLPPSRSPAPPSAPRRRASPSANCRGVIQWGAGGATDVVERARSRRIAEEALGKKIVLQNKTGGAGAIATNFVMQQPADGYTLLYRRREPAAASACMDLSRLRLLKFYPINIIARGNVLLVVNKDKPWKTLQGPAGRRAGQPEQGEAGLDRHRRRCRSR